MTPSQTPPHITLPPTYKNGNGSHESKADILIVDDREDKLLALEAVVERLNQNIVKVRSGKEALRQLLQKDFAVILLDVSMPGMDGFETASLIRKRPQSEHTPIIFVTSASTSENQMSRGYSLGAVDYILSPIVPEILRTKVSVFVELYKKTEEIREQSDRLRQIEEAEHNRKLAETVDKLEAETKRNRFFTLALDMLAIGDFDGHLLQVNPTWEKVLGYTQEELIGLTPEKLVHPDDVPSMYERVRQLRKGLSVGYFEIRGKHKDGSYRWIGWTAAPFPSEKLIYIFGRDITARKQAEEEIRSLNQQLNRRVNQLTEINDELEAFNYSISHDLRAPLRSMQGFAHALCHEYGQHLDEDGKEFARRIVQSSMYMDTLLHDLLDYSRLSRGDLTPEPVMLEGLFNEILAATAKEVEERKATIQLCRPLACVEAHLPTLRQVLSNLISNALKFVVPGIQPLIKIWTEPRDNKVRIWVADNGIGIAAEYREKIFRLFERLHSVQEYPGTGVGLALVRKGVERMGGSVGLESEAGKGSRFWVELPAAIMPEVQSDRKLASTTAPSMSNGVMSTRSS